MRLDEYLKSNNIKGKDFAGLVDINSGYLSQLRRHERWPGPDVIRRIIKATKGKVTADSFLEKLDSGKA